MSQIIRVAFNVFYGENAGDNSGLSVSAAGDINGDDVIIGAYHAGPNGNTSAGSGSSYVVLEEICCLKMALNNSQTHGSGKYLLSM